MRRTYVALVLLSAALLGGCQGGSRSEAGKSIQLSGGVLRLLQPEPVTIPEGTTFPLVLETRLSSATSHSGDLVVATLAEDLRVGQKLVVPAGSEVRGQVSAAVPSGRVRGDARLAFDFDTLVVKGKSHTIATRSVDIVELGSGTRVTVRLTRETRL